MCRAVERTSTEKSKSMNFFAYELTACRSSSSSKAFLTDDKGIAGGLAKRGVLVVEDDYFIALIIEDALTSAGYDIIDSVTNTEDALAAAQRQRPDFVFMDIRLSGGDSGIKTATQLFQQYAIRSIFVTAHSDPETKIEASEANPLGWVIKPFTPADLINALSNAAAANHAP